MAVGFKGAQPIDVNAVADTVFAPLGPQVAAATMPAVTETYQQGVVRQSSAQASLQMEQAQTRADRSLRLDELALEQARNRSAAVADVTAIYERSKGQFELGRGIAEQNLVQALEAEKQRDALLDERPAFLGNPVRWLADTWKAGKLEDEVARSKETALSAAQDVNALVQISSARIQESVAQATLVDAAYTQERVAEINKGFAAQQGLIDAGLRVTGTATTASQNVYQSSVELAQWAQRQAGQDLQERDLAFRKSSFKAQQEEKKQEQAADAQAAEYYMRANGLQPTPANKSAAWAAVVALKSSNPQGYADMVRAGAYSLDATSGTEAVAYGLKSGTVGSARTLGGWINDSELVKLGSDAVAREALSYEASLKAQGFAKAKESGYVGTEAAWFDSLGAAGKKALQTQARELAQQGIDRLPVTEFLAKQAGSMPIASSGLNVGAFGTSRPADTAAFYGVDAKAGAVLSKPEVRTRLEMAAAKGGNAKGTITQLAELRKILQEGGVANVDAVALQVLSRHAVGTAKEDSLVRHLSDRYGIAPQPQLNVVVGDKVYDLSSQALFTRAMEQGVESLEHVSLLERVGGVVGIGLHKMVEAKFYGEETQAQRNVKTFGVLGAKVVELVDGLPPITFSDDASTLYESDRTGR
jgi:hypothetical protein